MERKPINHVFADNLAYFMEVRKFNQVSLAKKSGVSQRTIGNYLRPELRQAESKTGKAPSAKLTEMEKIATALDVEPWELLRALSPPEREFYRHIEEAFRKLQSLTPEMLQEMAASATPAPAVQVQSP